MADRWRTGGGRDDPAKTYSLLDLFRPCTSRRCYAAPQYERLVLVLAGLFLVLAGLVLVNVFFKLKNINYGVAGADRPQLLLFIAAKY